jgi:chromosome partitioning protein
VRVHTLFNHAGGAGKTSLVRDLGFELASRGYRTLLVDSDPQANLTAWLLGEVEGVPEGETLLRYVQEGVLPTPRPVAPGLDLIPSSLALALAEIELTREPMRGVELRADLRSLPYDWILLDSLPSLGQIAVMTALAADGLIVPVETTPKGLQGLAGVAQFAGRYSRALSKLGAKPEEPFIRLVVPTRHDPRSTRHREALRALRELVALYRIAPPIAYRPAVHAAAIEGRKPAQAVSPEARVEMEGIMEALLQEVAA